MVKQGPKISSTDEKEAQMKKIVLIGTLAACMTTSALAQTRAANKANEMAKFLSDTRVQAEIDKIIEQGTSDYVAFKGIEDNSAINSCVGHYSTFNLIFTRAIRELSISQARTFQLCKVPASSGHCFSGGEEMSDEERTRLSSSIRVDAESMKCETIFE